MMVHDVEQLGQNESQGGLVVGQFEISIQRVKEPKRGIGGVIKAFIAAFGKHVWNQSVTNVMRERAQNPAGFIVAAGGQGQTFEADHSVAAPISEPVVA